MSKRVKLLFCICFMVPFVIWFYCLGQFIHNINIAKNGKSAVATVTGRYSNLTVNDERIYHLIYEYEDENNVLHTGRTSARYTYSEAYEMTVVMIKYNSNFESIEADFKYKYQIDLFILPLFGLVGIGFLVAIIIQVVNEKKDKEVMQYGFEGTGRLHEVTNSVMIVNGVTYKRVIIEYYDDKNQYHLTKLKRLFKNDELAILQGSSEFKIKYINDRAVIDESMVKIQSRMLEANPNVEKTEYKIDTSEKKCEYCGTVYDASLKKCPGCGSRIYEIIKND